MACVSVIIPTYNRSHFLKRAIESVIAQTFQDWELVIVDDGSKDNTEEIVTSYLTDKRIRFIKQINQGPAAARNRGISETSAEYICFLDDDDWWLPEKLHRQILFMEAHPDSGLVYTRVRVVRFADPTDDSIKTPPKLETTLGKIMKHGFISPCTVMVRRFCLNQMEWFKSEGEPQEDFELWLRFVQKWKISTIEDESWTCIEENQGQRFRMSGDAVKNITKRIEVIQNLKLIDPRDESLKNKNHSYLNYELGRHFYEEGKFFEAAKYFFKAVCRYPLVGLMLRRPEERGLKILSRLGKTYLSAPVCFVKGLFYDRR